MPYPTTSWPVVVDAALSRTDLVDFVMADDFNYPDEQIRTVQDWLGTNGDLIGDDGTAAHGPGGVASPIADGGIAFKIAAKVDYTSGKLLSLGDNNDVAYSEKLFVDFAGKMTAVGLTLGATQPVVGILDEDNMASDSDANLSTQQSIKAYVDATAIGFADPMTTRGDVIFKDAANATVRLAAGGAAEVLTSDGTDISWAALPASFADPMTTRGDVIIRNAANATARLAVGGAGEILTSDGTDIAWAAAAGGGLTTYTTVAAAELATPVDNDLCYVVDQEAIFRCEASSGATRDGISILNVASSGRWLVTSTNLAHRSMNASSIVIGLSAGQAVGGSLGNVVIGELAIESATPGTANVAIGNQCMRDASGSSVDFNVCLGYKAGYKLTGGRNICIGSSTMAAGLSGHSNVCLGEAAGSAIVSGTYNICIGRNAGGNNLTTASDNVIIGQGAGRTVNGNDNVIIGTFAGELAGATSGNVFIGHDAGRAAAVNNQLYIANTNTATPLIHGDFSTSDVTINGDLTVTGSITGATGFADPMTTRGDVIIRDAANATARLAVGANTHVLTSDGTDIAWAASVAGFADPMTTRGDVIIRNAANATARLAVGGAAEVLTSDGTDISWAAAASGFADPMTTRGDLIFKDAAGATVRLAAGTATHVLTSDGTDIAWAAATGGSSVWSRAGTILSPATSGDTLQAGSGAIGAPSYSFESDVDSGMYYTGTQVGFAFAGALVWQYAATAMASDTSGSWRLKNTAGSIAAPTFAFSDDTNTGMTSPGADSISLVTGGLTSVAITAQTLTKQYADVAPQIDLQSLKVTPSADDSMGQVRFRGYSSTSTVRTYAEIESLVIDDTNASEDGKLQFNTITGGSSTLCMELYGNDIYTPGDLDASGDISAANADLSGYVSAVDCKLTGVVEIDSTQVLKEQITGWAAATGTATRSTFLTTNVVLSDLAERVKALIDDLMSHGLIGA